MNRFFLLLILPLIACYVPKNQPISTLESSTDSISIIPAVEIITEKAPTNLDSLHKAYAQHRQAINQKRLQLKQAYEQANNDSLRNKVLEETQQALEYSLVSDLLPAWYGTTWDFNGHTDLPQQEEIACGYLISTSLKHAGFKLNRYKVAQQAASVIVDVLCKKSKTLEGYDTFKTYMKQQEDGLYIVGLDSHVGFIWKKADKLDFIHASFIDPGVAVREAADASGVLPYSWIYVVGNLSGNPEALKKWLFQTAITLPKP